ncbi:MAG: NAD(P)-binding domain-containing protein [Firmicutes bacterium]|nr:NAD(P)-binding domain-containing protein [Bacillota bacterium]
MARLLVESDLGPLFEDPDAVIDAMAAIREAMAHHPIPSVGGPTLPLDRGHLRISLGYLPGRGASLRTYPVGAYPASSKPPLYALWDSQGTLLALFADSRLSLWRTAAPAWLAATLLHPGPVEKIALLGSGRQAEGQLYGWARLRPSASTIQVYSPTPAHRQAFAERMSAQLRRTVEPTASAEMAVRDADLIGVCSNSRQPVLEASWLKPGALLVSIADGQLPAEVVRRCAVYASERHAVVGPDASRKPYADLVTEGNWEGIRGDLTELVQDRAPAPPQDRPVLFEMPGLGVWDTALAWWAYSWAEERGCGITL